MGTEYDTKQPRLTPTSIDAGPNPWQEFAASGNGAVAEQAANLRPSKRTVIPQNQDIPAHLQMDTSLPWNAPSGDIHFRAVDNPNGRGYHVQTNVAWSVFKGSTGGFAAGQLADGADELALNTLNQFVSPGSDGFSSETYESPYWARGVTNEASRTARVLEHDFRQEFIYAMPNEGGTISGQTIRQWIDDRQHKVSASRR